MVISPYDEIYSLIQPVVKRSSRAMDLLASHELRCLERHRWEIGDERRHGQGGETPRLARRGDGLANRISGWVSDVEEIFQRSSYFLNKRLRKKAKFAMKERVVPGENLVYEDIALPFQAACTLWNTDSQRESVALDDLCGQRQDHRAFKTRFSKFQRLNGKTRTLLAWLRTDPRFQINDIDMPAAGEQA